MVSDWIRESGVGLSSEEQNPAWVHERLQAELGRLLDECPRTLSDLTEFIDSGVEAKTALATDGRTGTSAVRGGRLVR